MQKLGSYELLERLAVGGMAEIYLARISGLDGFEKRYCLKMLHPNLSRDPSFGRILIEEAKLASQLNHSNIAQVYDLGQENDLLYIVMEYVHGRDLHAILKHINKYNIYLPLEVAAFIARDACAGLHYAHIHKDATGKHLRLVHRDVTPHNILVSEKGEVKLIDFGIAKVASQVREKTRAGVIKGKFAYMSPEQAWDRPLDARSDIFSLGICLYELLTGQPVYVKEEDPLAMLLKIRQADIAPPSAFRADIPPSLESILMRALSPEPQHRYSSALEFQKSLSVFLSQVAPAFVTSDLGHYLTQLFGAATEMPIAEEEIELVSDDDILESNELLSLRDSGAGTQVNASGSLNDAVEPATSPDHTAFIDEAQILAVYSPEHSGDDAQPATHKRSAEVDEVTRARAVKISDLEAAQRKQSRQSPASSKKDAGDGELEKTGEYIIPHKP